MVYERIAAKVVDTSILGTKLAFRCGRTANNRFLKAALSEKLSTYDATDLSKRGTPTPELINVYDKWGRGGYGVILTGNVMVDPFVINTEFIALIKSSYPRDLSQ
ncbi:hypothetical protein ANCCEY_10825 [Ancylostoma ceylanicum]|uniref:Uncharacterized protein n=1 Tax=Ancylostoma ceylanicum TaxID=53326 RepID=A0A0D6LFW2_9BILA|nr:hypothetical protein ANCCEY_10825 [Ancylostoma ceylanicum]